MKYEIEESLLQAILNYLALKPFTEVNQLIAAIQQCKQIKIQEEIK